MNKIEIQWEIKNIDTEQSFNDLLIKSFELWINGNKWTTIKVEFYVDEPATVEDENTNMVIPNPNIDIQYLTAKIQFECWDEILEELGEYIKPA